MEGIKSSTSYPIDNVLESLQGREVDTEEKLETTMKTTDSEGRPAATDIETSVLERETIDRSRTVDNDDADMQSPPISAPSTDIVLATTENPSTKRPRGRPKGSGKLQILASIGGYFAETAGGKVTPVNVTVPIGEDLAAKVFSLFKGSSLAVCVLSATGTVSEVVLRLPGSSGKSCYKGQFEILSLSGSYTHRMECGRNRPIGKLTIAVAKPDGQVIGGVVAGPLLAVTPIQLVYFTFKQNIMKGYKKRKLSTVLPATGHIEAAIQADTVITENRSSSPASQHSVGEYAIQVWKPIDSKETGTASTTELLASGHEESAADTVITENGRSSPSVGEYAIQVWKPMEDKDISTAPATEFLGNGYEEAADTAITENGSSSPSVGEYALQLWQPMEDTEICTAPTTEFLAIGCGEEDNFITENGSSTASFGEYALQLWRPMEDTEILAAPTTEFLAIGYGEADSFISENQGFAYAHSVDEYAMQEWKPLDDKAVCTAPTTEILATGYEEDNAITETQGSSLASPHSVGEYAQQECEKKL